VDQETIMPIEILQSSQPMEADGLVEFNFNNPVIDASGSESRGGCRLQAGQGFNLSFTSADHQLLQARAGCGIESSCEVQVLAVP
jgi:hypothetical protein